MSTIRALSGLAVLTAASALGLGRLDAATVERRRAAAEHENVRTLTAWLPPQTALERRPSGEWLARRADGGIAAWITTGTAPGWHGDIDVQIVVDAQGRMLGSHIHAHTETPAYTGDLRERWRRRASGEIDQLTGATVSARGIAAAIASAQARATTLIAAERDQ